MSGYRMIVVLFMTLVTVCYSVRSVPSSGGYQITSTATSVRDYTTGSLLRGSKKRDYSHPSARDTTDEFGTDSSEKEAILPGYTNPHIDAKVTDVGTVQKMIMRYGSYSKWKMSSATWICAPYLDSSPWEAHDLLTEYKRGKNEEDSSMMATINWPLMLIRRAESNRLCYFVDPVSHCYPPNPVARELVSWEPGSQKYYSYRFWGQAPQARLDKIEKMFRNRLKDVNDVNLDTMYISYFNDHVKEIRFDTVPS